MKLHFVRIAVSIYQRLLRRVCRQFWLKKKITILLYHEINVELFEEHLAFLSNTYNIIPLKQLHDALEKGDEHLLPDNPLAITFDDGWKSNYKLLPVVKKLQCPITIFLLAGLIGTNRTIWNYTLQRLGSERDFNTRLKATPNKEKNKILLEHNGYFPEKEYDKRDFLSLSEIEDMKDDIDFQAHGMFHPVFPMCDEAELDYELAESRKKLENLLEKKLYAFAYPYGRQGEREVEFVKKHGYKMARVASKPGLNSFKADPYTLKCIGIKNGTSLEKLKYAIARIELFELYKMVVKWFPTRQKGALMSTKGN